MEENAVVANIKTNSPVAGQSNNSDGKLGNCVVARLRIGDGLESNQVRATRSQDTHKKQGGGGRDKQNILIKRTWTLYGRGR